MIFRPVRQSGGPMSNTRGFLKGDRLGFQQGGQEILIGVDTAGFSTLVFGNSQMFTSNTINYGNAAFLFDFGLKRLAIGGLSSATTAIDVSGSLNVSGNVTGNGVGFVTDLNLQSTTKGLGQIYLSTLGTAVLQSQLTSSIQGLGTLGYISTASLLSSVRGLGTLGYISTSSLTSSIQGLGTLGFVSSLSLTSSLQGLGTVGFVSSLSLTSSLQGLGTVGFVSSLSLTSTLQGLGTFGYVSTPSLFSTVQGLGTVGYASTTYVTGQISSFSTSLGRVTGGGGGLASLPSTISTFSLLTSSIQASTIQSILLSSQSLFVSSLYTATSQANPMFITF